MLHREHVESRGPAQMSAGGLIRTRQRLRATSEAWSGTASGRRRMVAGLSSPLPRSIWAKSDPTGAPGESLTAHTNYVASQLARLAARTPGLTAVAGDDRLWHRAFW